MEDEIAFLPITSLREPKTVLRFVHKDTIDFLELRDSIRDKGVLQSLLVRPAADEGVYEIIDGLYRYTAARDAGQEKVPCVIKHGVSDDEVLILQIQANAISPVTTPAEYAQQMKRLLTRKPDMTIRQLACLIRKSPAWVSDRLGLLNLRKQIQGMTDRGEIPLENAYMLAKIPRSLQPEYVERAKLMPNKAFKALAAACVKQFMEAVLQGRMDVFYADKFQAQPHLRSLKVIESEIVQREVGALICAGEGCQNVLDGFYAGLRWACHLDMASVQEQEAAIRGRRERQALDASLLE